MFKRICVLLIAISIAVTACSSNQSSAFEISNDQGTLGDVAVSGLAAPSQASEPQAPGDAIGGIIDDNIQTQDRVILKNATLAIISADPAATINEITALAESMNGWVVTSTVNSFNDSAGEPATRGSITIRIPAERLTSSMETIKQAAVSVDAENVSGQDVTQEYVDTASRLSNLQASEEQLQTIMRRAETVEDILAIQQQLTLIRGEIESLQARINYFDEAAAFSSIRVDVNPPSPSILQTQSGGWDPGKTVENAVTALVSLLQGTIDLGISLIILGLPLLLIIFLPARWFWRQYKNRPKPAVVSQTNEGD